MARGRMLRRDICESDSFARINNSNAQLLLVLLTPWWDDYGKMIGDPAWIQGNIVRKLPSFTKKVINWCLLRISERADVVWWTDEKGNKWLYWEKFASHQTISDDKRHKDTLPSPKIPKNPQENSPIRRREEEVEEEVEVEVEVEGLVTDIISDLNLILKTDYKPGSLKTRELIRARFKEGHTVGDFKVVHRKMAAAWGLDNKMRPYLRPQTLYSNKFESYLNRPEEIRELTKQQQNNFKQLADLRKELQND